MVQLQYAVLTRPNLPREKRESKGEQSNLNNYKPISLPGMFLKSFKKSIIAILEATSGAASAPR